MERKYMVLLEQTQQRAINLPEELKCVQWLRHYPASDKAHGDLINLMGGNKGGGPSGSRGT